MLSLGPAVIFGLLNIIKLQHGALYMIGATSLFLGWTCSPGLLVVARAGAAARGRFGMIIERLLMRWIYKLDHLYGLLLTFGLPDHRGRVRYFFGVSGQPYPVPDVARGHDLGSWCCPITAPSSCSLR